MRARNALATASLGTVLAVGVCRAGCEGNAHANGENRRRLGAFSRGGSARFCCASSAILRKQGWPVPLLNAPAAHTVGGRAGRAEQDKGMSWFSTDGRREWPDWTVAKASMRTEACRNVGIASDGLCVRPRRAAGARAAVDRAVRVGRARCSWRSKAWGASVLWRFKGREAGAGHFCASGDVLVQGPPDSLKEPAGHAAFGQGPRHPCQCRTRGAGGRGSQARRRTRARVGEAVAERAGVAS